MRRVRLSVAMSLDGFIAGPNGESDWIVIDPDIDFAALMGAFDAILMGRKTYEATQGHGGGEFPDTRTFVFSRTLRQQDCPNVTVSDNPEKTLASLKSTPGKDIWLFGGGELFRSLLDLQLIDSVEIAVIPVLLGNGIPLMPNARHPAKLKLSNHRVYPLTGTVALEYVPVQ